MPKDSSKNKQSTLSLYTDEEIEGVSTTSSLTKNESTLRSAVNISEVSSTSEDSNQLPSTSSKSIFMELYQEDIVDSGSDNVTGVKDNTTVDNAKPKPGLSLLGEYADSGNDTEEEIRNSLIAKLKKPKKKKSVDSSTNKNSNAECTVNKEVNIKNDNSNKLEAGGSEASRDTYVSDDKISLTEEKEDDFSDLDIHALLDDSLAKGEKIKEEGQLSGSDSSESERSSDGKKDSKKLKEDKKDKSKKKDKKKKKKKRKKQKQEVEKKDASELKDVAEKKERKEKRTKNRSRSGSRSREISVKQKSRRQSRSRSRDRGGSGRGRHRSRSRSQDKRKKSKYNSEKSRRSRSRSSSRKHSTSKRNKHSKSYSSRSRSRNRSTSPPNKREKRHSSTSRTTTSRRDPPSSRKRKLSRSQSPHKQKDHSSEHRRSRSPKRHSPSPGKKRKAPSEENKRLPNKKLSSKKTRSPDRREGKHSPSPTRKLSHRTSSPSDSLDSGHFTNIPLSKTSQSEDLLLEDKVEVQKSPAMEKSPEMEKQKESISSIPSQLAVDFEKQRSPSCSPVKAWEDEFDLVFTERLSPREGTEKSVEDVLFGKEMAEPKTPDFKRTTLEGSIKSKSKEPQNVEKKKETKENALNGNKDIVSKQNDTPQELKTQQSAISDVQSTPIDSVITQSTHVDSVLTQSTPVDSVISQSTPVDSVIKDSEQCIANTEDSKANASVSTTEKADTVDTCKTDHGHAKDTNDIAAAVQAPDESDKSTRFLPSKLETIPFLDEAPPAPPPVSGDCEHPKTPASSQLGLLGPAPDQTGLLPTSTFHGRPWAGLRNETGVIAPRGSQGLLPTPRTLQKLYSGEKDIDKMKRGKYEPAVTRKDEGRNYFNSSPVDMELSSPEGDIIDRLNEEFWKQQQQNQSSVKKIKQDEPKQVFVESMITEQSSFEEPYEPESGLIINDEFEEDLNSITDPKERRRREKEQQKEKTKVQVLIDKLHRQARVEEEVKHVLKAYYKHKDIDKEEYKSILRKAVPQVTNSNSSIDPERIRSLVKKYVAKIKGERFNS